MGNRENEADRWSEVPALLRSLYETVGGLEALFPGRPETSRTKTILFISMLSGLGEA